MPPGSRSLQPQSRRLALYRRLRRGLLWCALLLVGSVAGAQFYPGSTLDFRRFDQKRWTVLRVLDGDTFELADRARTRVLLLGVDAPDPPDTHYSLEAHAYLTARVAGRAVLLKLDGTQTRAADGRLLAYAYLTDTNLLNADIIRDGRAYSDRRVRHTFRPQFDHLENEARTRVRGLWSAITPEKMPQWRRRWLESLDNR